MRLSDFRRDGISLVRDGSFDALGLSNSDPGAPFLTFVEDPRWVGEALGNSGVSCVLCSADLLDEVLGARGDVGVAVCDRPRWEFFSLHNLLCGDPRYAGAPAPTEVDPSAEVSPLAYVAPEGVLIGPGAVVEPFASLCGRCSVGAGAVVRSGARVGQPGFEYKRDGLDVLAVRHAGSVLIGDGVELKANSSVDSAVYPWDATVIGERSKVNAGAHVDHGVRLGRAVFVGANAVVSGRAVVGDGATVGPGAVVSNRRVVGARAAVSLGAVVTKDVPAGARVSGNFAIPHEALIARVKRNVARVGPEGVRHGQGVSVALRTA